MLINLTLLVQACNFYVAYWLIDRILLRQIVSFIHNEHKLAQDLVHNITAAKENIKRLEQEKETQKSALLILFKNKTPENIFDTTLKISFVTFDSENQSIIDIYANCEKQVKELEEKIFSKLGAVY